MSFTSSLVTLVDVLREQALRAPEERAYTFLPEGEAEGARLTWGELDGRARAIAAVLQERGLGGERIILLFPPGLDFVAAFFGCLYAGAVAVPCYPPRSERNLSRLLSIVDDASPRAALTCAALSPAIPRWQKAAPELERIAWIDLDAPPSGAEAAWLKPGIGSSTLAFLQYTSGSTSTPKGVMVSHGNLVHNERLIQHAFRQRESSLVVGWLPLYHDMGLIGNVLQPLWSGASCVLMPPLAFLQKPRRWLEAIHHYRATTSGGPNFAYELCLQKIAPADREGLDLSSWTVAFNGAEPVRAATQERFAEAFAPCGFRREAFYPCYGLAEATLFVSGGVPGEPAVVRELDAEALAQNRAEAPRPGAPARSLVSCGRLWLGQELAVVDPETGVPCEPGGVGEVWVAGASVTGGYWNRPEETAAAFGSLLPGSAEGPFLRTGDLGFVLDGELYITGRLKDLVILRGRNHYPQDLELTAERSYRALRPGCGAAFSVDVDGEERLVIVQEVDRQPGAGVEEMADAIRQAIAEEHEVQVYEVVLARFGAVPKTTSGKVQRRLCRSLYLQDRLPRVGSRVLAEAAAAAGTGDEESAPEGFLRRAFARLARLDPTRIAPDRPLTALGLDSLMAVELKASVEAEYGVQLPLASLLEGASVREIAGMLAGRPAARDGLPLLRPGAVEAGDLPLSEGQKALWFLERLAPEAGTYNIAVAARALGGLDAEALRHAFEALVLRHSALRSVFPIVGNERGDEPVRRVLERPEIDFQVEDAAGWSEDRLQAELSAGAWRPFDLGRGPLVRVRIFDRSAGGADPVLLLVVHHIAADFVSFAVAARDLAQGGGPPLRVAYGDFVRWQEDALSGPRGERLWGYWREALAGVPDLDLPTDRPRPPVQTWRGGARTLELPSDLISGARTLAAAHGATPFMVLLAVFQAQLGRISGQDDLAVGTPTAGRSLPGVAPLMGYFVNTVALRADLSGELSFAELLDRVRRMAIDGLEHGDFPFARIAERLRPMRDPSRSPVFQAMFLLQGARPSDPEGLATFALGESGGRLSLGGLELESLRIEERRAQLDLTLRVAEEGYGRLRASLEFNTDLFDTTTVERMLGHWQTLLAGAVADPSRAVWRLPLLTSAEREQLLVTWNATVAGPPFGDLLLHQLFEAQAVRTPAAEAVVAGEERLTYQELNARANRLARHLQTLGVGPEVRVGIQLGRGADLIVALLAVLKAGGAYVPLDAKYPQERLELMRADSGARVVLEDVAAIDLTSYGASDLAPSAQPGNLAYLIYTSGSTGRPKAVALEHRSPVALMHWARRIFSGQELSGVLASTSTAFDLSVFEIFVPLSWGGRVILAENALELPRLAASGEVRLVNTVPSALAELVRSGGLPSSVRTVNLAGEPVPSALADAVCAVPGIESLYNLYGPSEDTTYSTFTRLTSGRPVTIGRPLDDTRAYVLDGRLEPVPEGVPGELYLGGAGLARGYLGRPELTAERFIPDPFSEGRLYRTGDLVRWRNAELEFLGRIDHQVKIRGFRIELGEIEAALLHHPAVREAAVLALPERSGDGLRLVAYVSLSGEEPALAAWLRERLPETFVPTGWVVLPALPLSPNGKVDRKALARIELAAAAVAGEAPRTPLETTLAGIFAGVLGLERVGVHDDFFALGGHSLLATRLMSRLNRAFGVDLPVSALFQAPTVVSLAERVGAALGGMAPPIFRVPRDRDLLLSFAQQRLWFLHQLEPDSSAYHISLPVRMSGSLQPAVLAASFDTVVARHEALRTTFEPGDNGPVQRIAPYRRQDLPLIDLGGLPVGGREAEARHLSREEAERQFDLRQGPLLRSLLLRLDDQEHLLLLVQHHIVSDGWSMEVLIQELSDLYRAFGEGRPSPLPELPVQYPDYAVWQRRWLQGAVLEREKAWWRGELSGCPQVLELPVDRPRPPVLSGRGETVRLDLPAELSRELADLSRRLGATLFMTLLASFQVLLARWSGQEELLTGIPIANRNRMEIEGLIGFFVNTLVLRGRVDGRASFAEMVRRVRERTLAVYAHQDLPFEALVEELQPERDPSRSPLFQVMLTLQNAPLGRPELPGVQLSIPATDTRTAKFDLSLSLAEEEGVLRGALTCSADLFDRPTMARLAGHFRTLLEAVVSDSQRPMEEIALCTPAELHQALVEWNDTQAGAPELRCFHQLFAEQAWLTPEAMAVLSEDGRLTYRELDQRSSRLAHRLLELGAGPGRPVALYLERSTDFVAAILAAHKAGAAYLPLDPAFPAERVESILADAEPAALVTRTPLLAQLGATGAALCLDQEKERLRYQPQEPPAIALEPEDLAYVIYTSGSTGRPKGVAVEHRHLTSYLRGALERLRTPSGASWGVVSTLAADLGHTCLFPALVTGGCVHVVSPDRAADPEAFADYCRRHPLDVLKIVPSHLAALESAQGAAVLPRLRLVLGGEAFDRGLAERLCATVPTGCRVFNHYGPTETTVGVAACTVEVPFRGATVPLGRPLADTRAYVADDGQRSLPIGVPGELLLGGDHVARGYFRRPDLTAERFIPNPFGARGERLYRTGDRVRLLADGRLEFLGRIDRQVKIRGFRVELGEIEAVLVQHPAVQAAVVEARPDRRGERRLVAWFVADEGFPASGLETFLVRRLPRPMVPAAFVPLESLPLTANGKVDRRALPEPEAAAGASSAQLLTPVEEVIAAIWADLLGLDRVGATESFFDLGGHSLLATRAVSRLRVALGAEVPLRTLFEAPTVAGLARRIGATGPVAGEPIRPQQREDALPLSYGQQRLWFLDRLEPGSSVYNMPAAVRLRGRFDRKALETALGEIVRRHEVLRTVFPELSGEPVQVVLPPQGVELPAVDLGGLASPEPELERLALEDARRPFDLARGPVLRASLLRLGEEHHALLLALHHVAGDGWSVGLFLRELGQLYGNFAEGRPAELPELPVQYGDFAAWQREHLSGKVLEELVGYWRQRLAGLPALELPADRPRPSVPSYRGVHERLALPAELTRGLEALSRREGVTLFMTLLGAFGVLLSRYSGQEDFAVGSPIAGRSRGETENLIGFFVNILVLRCDLAGDPNLGTLLAQVRETCLEAYAHQDAPFDRLVEELRPERDLSRSPIFQVMLAFQNESRAVSLPGVQADLLPLDGATARFDLTLSLNRSGAGLAGIAELATDLFDRTTIARLLHHFQVLLEGAAADAGRRLSELPLLEETELRQVLCDWNRTERPWPQEATLHDLFAAQAARTPGAVALVVGEERLTYARLRRRADHVADALRALGVGPEVRVAICAERSMDLVVAVLGVLAAGGAYVPLDPRYPRARLEQMLEDCAAPVLLTQTSLRESLPPVPGARVLLLDGDLPQPVVTQGATQAVSAGPGNAAYVIYTSGSTGRPKGVEIEHRSAVALVAWALETFPAGSLDGMLFSTSVCFDLSVFELFVPLSSGGKVILAGNALDLPNLPAAGEVTFLNTVPSAMVELVRSEAVPASVQVVGLAGEPLRASLVESIERLGTVEAVFNLYGPTEDTTYSTWTRVDRQGRGERWTPPIGRPLSNSRAYVLDRHLRPVPAGVPGELYLAGSGLARGYLGRPEATAERFVPDPFNDGKGGGRLYRTGDLVRWRNAELEYLGRIDYQVKVRGFRIELGEIEALLSSQQGVREAAVLVHDEAPAGPRLVAYVEGEPAAGELRRVLEERLPSYMVPSAFIVLESFPLTPNGKVDRGALRSAMGKLPQADRESEEPRTPVEELVAAIWADLLGLDRVGATESFFELGGHSLLATRVVSRMRDAFGIELPLRTLFETPTVEGLAHTVEAALRSGVAPAPPIVPVRRDGDLPLSFAQQRLWFIDQLEPGSSVYNVPAALRLAGTLDSAALAASLEEIVARHEALRTTFHQAGEEAVQRIAARGSLPLPLVDLARLQEPRREAEARRLAAAESERPFDLARGPLVRAMLLRLDREEHVALLTLHHIVSDGWSVGVLVREVAALYGAFTSGQPSPLPPLPVQYADFAVWQRTWLRGAVLEDQLGWWRERLAGAPPALELPTDRSRPALRSGRGAVLPFRLSAELAGALAALSRQAGATLFMVLLAAWKTLLFRVTTQEDLVVGTPIANRNRTEIESLIGFFINTLALRGDLAGELPFQELLRRVCETTLAAYTHQDLPFEKLVQELSPERSLAHTPLFQVMFTLQNFPYQRIELAGLSLSPVARETSTVKFDLELTIMEVGDGLSARFDFASDLFDPSTILRLSRHLLALLEAVTVEPGRCLGDLPLLSEGERHQLRTEWNDTPVPAAPGVVELVAAQVRRSPDALAVVFAARAEDGLTYRELDRQAGILARRLRALGVGPEVPVGLCVEHGPELAVAVLGIFQSGGACVPLDPAHPPARLAFLLEDSAVPVVVTQLHLLASLPPHRAQILLLGAEGPVEESGVSSVPAPGTLAYRIYTSGTTGRPKAVEVEHGMLAATLAATRERFGLTAGDRMSCLALATFDIFFFELLSPLLAGGTAVFFPLRPLLDVELVVSHLGELTCLHAVPALMRSLVDALRRRGREAPGVGRLRQVFVGGDAVPADLLVDMRQTFSAARVWILYGPTEGTIVCAAHPVAPPEPVRRLLGTPLPGAVLHVCDTEGELLPIGVPGELWIGGPGVTRGYLGREELTAEKYVLRGGERFYRSGDRVRRLADGTLEFLGRLDHQVKVRGFRIELEEIEEALSELEVVREAVVVMREDRPGDGRLVAYVVGDVAPEALRSWLRERLPEYMVPSTFVILAALPLTPHGKVDRKALAATEPARSRQEEYLAPRTPVEEVLSGIWADLLGLERVGVADHFFDLGGHSLLAAQVKSRLRQAFGVEMPLRDLFVAPRLADLATRVEASRLAGVVASVPPLLPTPREGALPLSFAQQRLWFLDQLGPCSPLYNVPAALRVEGPLDTTVLVRCLGEIVRRHEALRTVFAAPQGSLVQVIRSVEPFRLPVVDLSALPESAREDRVRALAAAEAGRPFDLGDPKRDPLLRGLLLRLGDRDHAIVLTMHHIASDGWSMGLLVREIAALYPAFAARWPSPLPELPVQYADFAVWQQSWLHGEVLEREIAFWRQQLAGLPSLLELPTDRPRPAVQSHRGAARPLRLPSGPVREMGALARREGATLFMVLLAGFHALLSRWSGQDDLAVGSPVAGRNWVEVEGLIGFFVNTLVLRGDLSEGPSFRELLGQARETALAAYVHQDVPFEKLVEELAPQRSLAHTPLFQVALVLQNAPLESLEIRDLRLQPFSGARTTAKFDLTLNLAEQDGELAGGVEYAADLFDATTIDRWIGCFERFLAAAAASPERGVADLPLLSEAERQQALRDWAGVADPGPAGALIHELFAAQAARSPRSVALVCGEARVTYADLDARADRLAAVLRDLGVGPEVPVGLCAERSIEMIVGLLGILKAGGAYVPLDPESPRERLRLLLEEASATLVLTGRSVAGRLPEHAARVVDLDGGPPPVSGGSPATGGTVGPESLAYVMYTSGSTGRPKGVGVCHRGVVRLCREGGFARFDEREVFLQAAPLSFDASTLEIWACLLNGGRLVLPPPGALGLEVLGRIVREQGVTTLWLTAGLFHLMVDERLQDLVGVRQLLAGGDVLSVPHVKRVRAELPACRVINGYGPTENTTFTCCHPVEQEIAGSVPIGRPIRGTRIYIVDRKLAPVPAGVAGELLTGGAGLARGYLNRPDLTAEQFIPDPHGGEPGERLYRTGDLCRYRPDGTVEFLGRADHQVKIRGFRIEPGEIEAALVTLPGVRQAVVLAREDRRSAGAGDRRLVAYVVGDAPADALRQALRERLPDHMMPTAFVALGALPRTPNGKVDRQALPVPERHHPMGDSPAPRTPVEELLAGIWTEVLGLEAVGINDDFFELGGHSLLATRLISRIRAAFGVELPLTSLFKSPTVAGLAAGLKGGADSTGGSQVPPLAPMACSGEAPLSFAQQRLWFLDQLEPESSAYNVAAALRIAGNLDPAALATSLEEIVVRHEALRTTFHQAGEEAVQRIAARGSLPLPLVDLAGLPELRQEVEARRLAAREAERPFDLARGPLVRATLLRLGREEHVVLLTLHHIVSDGWSIGVLVREVAALYPAFASGRPSPLPELPVQYADFALWQRGWLQGEALEARLRYWRERLASAPSALELPTDRPRPAAPSGRGGLRTAVLPAEVASGLISFGRREGSTLFMTLFAAFQALLHRYTGQEDLLVGTPIANRNRAEIEDLIGFFVNTLVLRTDVSGAPSFRDLAGRVREEALGAYAHQDLPFERLVEELAPERSLAHTPLFQAMFTLQNAPIGTLELPGLALSPLQVATTTAKFDLTLGAVETAAGLSVSLEHSRDLFDASTADRMLGHFTTLLVAAIEEPERRAQELPLLGSAERHQLLVAWRTAEEPVDQRLCLHELIEAQASLAPDAVAAVCDGQSLTHGELDRRAGELANRLRRLGVGPEVPVGVLLESSLDLVVGLLAVLKAGGIYLPLDPDYPRERLSYMLEDSGAPVVLTLKRLAREVPVAPAYSLCLDAPGESAAPPQTASGVTPSNLAYLIYTSGSTGQPKAVGVEHGAAAAHMLAMAKLLGLSPGDRVLQFYSSSFDSSLEQILPALISGAALVLRGSELWESSAFLGKLAELGLTVIDLPSAYWQQWVRECEHSPRPCGLGVRNVSVGGDVMSPEAVRLWWRTPLAGVPLFNMYGPTETVVTCTRYRVDPGLSSMPGGAVRIGRPLAGREALVLDREGGLAPIGVPGELHIGGLLARGYRGRPDLTADRFRPDPFGDAPGQRLYRTGDLARFRPDGEIEFLGRLDHQVKVRGFRIELGEIEAALAALPGLREAVVAVRGEGAARRLVAYLVPEEGRQAPAADDLRTALARRLPLYMVPASFVALESLPLTPNGKVDRRALPDPAAARDASAVHVAPRTPVEELLAGIWAGVLGVDRVSVDGSFFDLGGHSLQGMRLMAQVQDAFGVSLGVKTLFESPTVAGMALAIARKLMAQADEETLAAALAEMAELK